MAQCVAIGPPAAFTDFAAGASLNAALAAVNAVNTAFLTQTSAFISAPGNPAPNQEGGGVWVRGVGGELNTKNTGSATFAVVGGGPIPGGITCDTRTRTSFGGVQAGTDMARLNVGMWNVHLGATVGFLSTSVKDNTLGGPFSSAGVSTGKIDVPFAGIYAAATYGGFFVDGQLRFDYHQASGDNPNGNVFNQELDGRGVAFTGNIGYNAQLGNGWFIEPSGGVVVSKVRFDSFTAAGTLITGGAVPPLTTQFGDINTTLGRLSLRGGTTFTSANIAWQPFATVSVYHEFNSSVTTNGATAAAAGGIVGFPDFTGTAATTQLGTYGQFGIGVAAQVLDTGWLGYFRGDYRTGNKIEGYSFNGGIRYQFAPDLVANKLITKATVKAPVAMVVPYNWTGYYIGANLGAEEGWSRWTFNGVPTNGNVRPAGVMAGGQAGYDQQIGQWVLGVEGMVDWSNSHGARGCPQNPFIDNCESKLDFLATLTGRVGYAFWNRAIVYVKGGVAVGDLKERVICNTDSRVILGIGVPPGCPAVGEGQTKAGYTVGFGSEFALAQNWTVKGETSFFDLGKVNFNGFPVAPPASIRTDGFTATVALNYRFH